jgi:hypothetical protein
MGRERGIDKRRRGATSSDNRTRSPPVAGDNRFIELLERENEFLRHQISVKDQQIADQLERAHETNTLINGLQRMLGPLLAAPEPPRAREQHPEHDMPARNTSGGLACTVSED